MGNTNLNFYKILSRNDNMILRQSSKLFQRYTPLYGQNVSESNLCAQNLNLIKCHIFEDLQNPFSEDVIFKGNKIGRIDGVIEIKKIPLLKQIMCGVHTENGFDISSVHLHNAINQKSTIRDFPNELKILIAQKNSLLDKFFPSTLKKLDGNTNEKPGKEKESFMVSRKKLFSNYFDEKKFENNQNLAIDEKATFSLLNEIKTTLKKSCKESLLIYNLSNQRDITMAQKEMIDLGINLVNLVQREDVIDDTRRTAIFDILILLFNRAEIGLRLMAIEFDKFPSEEKIEVCRDFIELLNKTLFYSLEKLAAGKSGNSETNEFVEFFLSVCYFRIPLFRKVFISAISSGISDSETKENLEFLDKDMDFNKSSNSYQNINADTLNINNELNNIQDDNETLKEVDLDPINSLMDWENLFYYRIEKFAAAVNKDHKIHEIIEKIKETEDIIKLHKWEARISKRGNAFFSMIIRLDKYIQSKVILLRNLRWFKIPGFKFIINSIIHELKKREVSLYQEPLIKLVTLFINDSDISNFFINIILRRTK